MSQTVRYVLFIAISVVILIGWQFFFAPKPQPRPPGVAAADAGPGAPDAGLAAAPAPAPAPGPAPAPEIQPEPAGPAETHVVETPLWRATFTTEGAALESFELLGDKNRTRPREGERRPRDLADPDAGQPLPLSTELGDNVGFGPTARWRLAAKDAHSVTFERTAGAIRATKRFSWEAEAGYRLRVEVSAQGAGAPIPVTLRYTAFQAPEKQEKGLFGMGGTGEIHASMCHLAGEGRSVERHTYSDDQGTVSPAGTPTYAGIDFKYFVSAIAPVDAQGTTCHMSAPKPGQLEAALRAPLAPGATRAFDVYVGPKEEDRLKAFGHEVATSVDYGFFAVIAELLLKILQVFEKVVRNWGIAIVLLTLLVKAITFPLTQKQMKSMEEMRRLAPKLEEIKTKYAGDQQRVNLETMKMYKEHNVQPLGGCLPMLVQMPVWFALYTALNTSFDLYNEQFIAGWIGDLTSRDPYYVLPVLMTVTMVLTQVLTPQPQANQQMKVMTYGMPLFFGFIMLSLPAGLVLYIFTNNLLSIAHSLWFRRRYGHGQALEMKPKKA